MPSSLFADGSVQGDALDDQRALQIALDQLSLLDLDNDENPLYDNNQEPRKKSVNMTECVPVPSSEHVAEIVGRQGACFLPIPCTGTRPDPLKTAERITRVVVVVAQRDSRRRADLRAKWSRCGSTVGCFSPPGTAGPGTAQMM